MRGDRLGLCGLFSAALFAPLANAQMGQRTLSTFAQLSQDSAAVFALSFILVFMLLYAIFAAAMAKIKVFKGDHGVTKHGKIVAVAMALLAAFAIFYGAGTRAPYQLADILTPFGVFGGLLLALVAFLLIYAGFRGEGSANALPVALAAAGLGMVIVGAITAHPNISAWGWIIAGAALVLLLLFMLFHALSRGNAGSHVPASAPQPYRPTPPPGTGPPRGGTPRTFGPARASPSPSPRSAVPAPGAPSPRPQAPAPSGGAQPQTTAPAGTPAPSPVPSTADADALRKNFEEVTDILAKLSVQYDILRDPELLFPEDQGFEYADVNEKDQEQRAKTLCATLDTIHYCLQELLKLRKSLPSYPEFQRLLEEAFASIIAISRPLHTDLTAVHDRYVRHDAVPKHITAKSLNDRVKEVARLLHDFLRQSYAVLRPGTPSSVKAPGQASPPAAPHTSAAAADNLRREIITKYLSYQDAALPKETKEEALRKNLSSPTAAKYADALIALSKETGFEIIQQTASRMVTEVRALLGFRNLGIPLSPYGASTSWAMWDIAKQYYYYSVHGEELMEGYTAGHPLTIVKIDEMIYRQVGWEVYAAYRADADVRERMEKAPDTNAILALLRKAPKENGTLSAKDLAELGMLLRELGTLPPKFGKPGYRVTDKDADAAWDVKWGWKLHVDVLPQNYAKVDEWLWQHHKGQYKLLTGGDPAEGDFTIYIGSRDATELFARQMESAIGQLIEFPSGRKEEMPFGVAGKIVGRFDPRSGFYRDYIQRMYEGAPDDVKSQIPYADFMDNYRTAGANMRGVPIGLSDINLLLWGDPADLPQRREAALRKMFPVLTDAYGDYFTGTTKFSYPISLKVDDFIAKLRKEGAI